MSFWKDLVDKVTQKKEELEDEAKKRAAKMALDTGKAAAKAAVKNAGKTLDYAGKKLEAALFGEATRDDDARGSTTGATSPADPFAKLKADEAARKAAAKEDKAAARAREDTRAKTEREVEDELAALKKKIGGP